MRKSYYMYKKTSAEIQLIQEGGKILGDILEQLLNCIQPGVSAKEIDIRAEQLIREVGGVPAFLGYKTRSTDSPFPGTICFSLNDEVVHGIPKKDKIVKAGDIVSIDIGMIWGGLFTDTAATVIAGSASDTIARLISVTQEALEIGIRACCPGNTVASIGKAIEEFVKSHRTYGIIQDLVGHGVGHALHEDPRVPNYYDNDLEHWPLSEGVVLAIEPMITLGAHQVNTAADGWGIVTRDRSLSAHFEHTVIVTEKGPVVATRRPYEYSRH